MSEATNQTLVREKNLSNVLRCAFFNPSHIYRAELARRIGLKKSTISSLVEELISLDLLRETGVDSSGELGRPATFLEVNSQGGFVIGLELGPDSIAVMVTDFKGRLVWERNTSSRAFTNQDDTLAKIYDLLNEAMTICKKNNSRILGLGVAVPGLVDVSEGKVIYIPHLDWHDVPLKELLVRSTGLSLVIVNNNANAAAVGEHLFGVAQNIKNFIFILAGIGIGSGLFLNGELYGGKNGFAGEVGHMPIIAKPFQNKCDCGNFGCWGTYANQDLFLQRMQDKLKMNNNAIVSSLMKNQNAPLSIPILKQAADQKDEESVQLFRDAGEAIGIGVAALINIFNPDKVIVGGSMSISKDYILPSIKETVKNNTLPIINHQAEILISAFGPKASINGAIASVVDHILENPTIVKKEASY